MSPIPPNLYQRRKLQEYDPIAPAEQCPHPNKLYRCPQISNRHRLWPFAANPTTAGTSNRLVHKFKQRASSFAWDFGDGIAALSQSLNIYSNAGSYTVNIDRHRRRGTIPHPNKLLSFVTNLPTGLRRLRSPPTNGAALNRLVHKFKQRRKSFPGLWRW